jgi:hypothetical protein
MSYTVKPITQYAVINDDNGQTIATYKDRREAEAIVLMMAGHGTPWQGDKPRDIGRLYTFADWAKQ